MSRSELNILRWLEAHSDRSAGLMTLPGSAVLADVVGDSDYRLVIADIKLETDMKSRLKVYKGTLLTADLVLDDVPSAVVSFYADCIEPRLPAVAVSCASDLLVYRNNKLSYIFTLPSSPLPPLESEIWGKLTHDSIIDVEKILEDLKSLPFKELSPRSQELLLEPPSKCEEYIRKYLGKLPIKTPPITCMTVLNRASHDKMGVACPVLATETGDILILDPINFGILHQANTCNIKSTPSIIKCTGLYDVEFRIVIATREKHICLLRKGYLEGKSIIQLAVDIIDILIIPGDNFIIVAARDKMLHCYTKRGQRLWSTKMINSISCLCLITLEHVSSHLIAVGLKGGPIHLYQNRHPVDYTSVPDTPSVITFGRLGQEDHVMVIITIGGTINFKILKRTADFNLSNQDSGILPALQGKPLPLPKRSKLFLEQSMRERENAVDIHQCFQQDLIRLRLTAARNIVQNLTNQTGIGNEKEQIKLSAQVLGLGPKFTLILTLENMNADKCITGFTVIYHTKPNVYNLSSYINSIPLVPPSLSYKLETKVVEILTENFPNQNNLTGNGENSNVIRVFVTREGQSQPVLAALINMPPTEMAYAI